MFVTIDAEGCNLISTQRTEVDHLTVLPKNSMNLLKAEKLWVDVSGFRSADYLPPGILIERLTAIRLARRKRTEIGHRSVPLEGVSDEWNYTVQTATD